MFFGRGISAFFNQFFKWLFWNKTGQKLLFSVVIVFIFFCFIKLGEVSAVEEVQDVNYVVYENYSNIINDAILRIDNYFAINGTNNSLYRYITSPEAIPYFYYGAKNGSSYNGGYPANRNILNIARLRSAYSYNKAITTYDYMAVTGFTMYNYTLVNGNDISISQFSYSALNDTTNASVYMPIQLVPYYNDNWVNYIQALKNNDMEQIQALLTQIEEDLSNTTPTSETDSFVEVDSSAIDDVSSSSVDNVFSTMTTGFANKFTNYDLSTVNSFVWNFKGTTITFYSDTIYKMIRGTFFETLLSMLWYYIFGHYAFVWLSSIIHKIKDGSILDGLQVNEVITKEML